MTNATILNRVERACVQLRQDGKKVTFTAVADATGIGRTTLYRNPDLRAVIDQHRHHAAASDTHDRAHRRTRHPAHRHRSHRRPGPQTRRTTPTPYRRRRLKR